MRNLQRFHVYHWLLAGFFVVAYLSGDDAGLGHAWLGYGLLLLLLFRLATVLTGSRGFPRLRPAAGAATGGWSAAIWGKGLIWSMLLAFGLLLVTGVLMVDNAAVVDAGLQRVLPAAMATSISQLLAGWPQWDAAQWHEQIASLSLVLIALHIGWLLCFRLPMVRWMLGLASHGKAAPDQAAGHALPQPVPYRLTVSRLQPETLDTLSIELALPAALQPLFCFQPGQFVSIGVEVDGACLWRCYSITSQPGESTLSITVKRVPGGKVSGYLHDAMQVGMTLLVLPPAGSFRPRSPAADLLLLAGGSGITPLYAILRHALQQGSGRVRLVYVSQQSDSVIFGPALAALQARYPDRLSFALHLSASQGRLDAAGLTTLLANGCHGEVLLCGPAGLLQLAQSCLMQLGVPASAIQQERFGPAAAPLADGGNAVSAQITLHGKQHAILLTRGSTLLNALEGQGVQPPSHCRAGVCGTCRCKVSHGRVSMQNNQVLTAEEVASGWALACQAEPLDSTLHVSFDEPVPAARAPTAVIRSVAWGKNKV